MEERMKDEAGLTCVPIQASVQTHWGTNEKSHSHNLFIYLRKDTPRDRRVS